MSKKMLALALKFLVLGFLFWFLSRGIDFAEAGRRLAAIDPLMLAGAAGVMLVQICVGGQRWRLVLSAIGAEISIFKAIQLFYIGVFFSQALPSSVGGDAVRMFKVYKLGMELRNAINGVLLERAVTVVALVALIDVTLQWFLPRVDEATAALMLPAVVLVTVGCIVGLAFLMFLDRLPSSLRRWRLVRGLGNLGIDARKVFLVPGHLATVLFWGILTHINMAFIVLILALGLELNVTLLDCLTLVPPVMLIKTPVAPCMETSSKSGLEIAASEASSARFSPSASPVPIMALPISPITARTSAKSRLIRPGMIIRSVTPRTPE